MNIHKQFQFLMLMHILISFQDGGVVLCILHITLAVLTHMKVNFQNIQKRKQHLRFFWLASPHPHWLDRDKDFRLLEGIALQVPSAP